MPDRVPIIVLKDRDGENYAYRCGQEMFFFEKYNVVEDRTSVEVNIIGRVKDLILSFDMSIYQVVGMIETAEREALKRMKEND